MYVALPVMFPDLSPIEPLCDELGRIRNCQNLLETHAQLIISLFKEWNNISKDLMRRLIESMQRRCQSVIDARDVQTRY